MYLRMHVHYVRTHITAAAYNVRYVVCPEVNQLQLLIVTRVRYDSLPQMAGRGRSRAA